MANSDLENAAHCLSAILKDLVFWGTNPDPEPRDNAWLKAYSDQVIDATEAVHRHNLPHDKAVDGKTKDARRLALEFATLLASNPTLAVTPAEEWSLETHRRLLDDLDAIRRWFEKVAAETPKTRRKPVSKTAKRDKKFVELAEKQKSSNEIATWWNNHQTKENISPEAVRKAIERQRKRDKV